MAMELMAVVVVVASSSSSWAAWTGDSREERGVRSEDGQPGVSLPPDISARAVLGAGAGLLLRLLQEC
jgi:hypothetical protein